jgi:arylsulfatase A-like enzyme
MVLSGDHTNFYRLRDSYGRSDSYFDGSMQSRYYVNDDRLVIEHVADMPPWDGTAPVEIQFHLMSTHGLGKRYAESTRYQPARNYYRRSLLEGGSAQDRAQAVNYYDNGVVQLDATLQELIPLLARKGYLDHALLVVTGDHGDQLGEHDTYAHANSTWEPVLRVPFVMIDFGGGQPAFPPQAVASQADIAPTLLHALGMPIPDTWQGVPLQTPLAGRSVVFQEGFATGLYDTATPGHTYKYWRDWHAQREHVFDIDSDPGEERDLVTQLTNARLAGWRRSVLGNVAAGGIDATEHDRAAARGMH